MYENEDDISAEETFQSESSRIQSENEHKGWKKSFSCKKIKRKKEVIRVGRIYVAYFPMYFVTVQYLHSYMAAEVRRIHEISAFRVFKKEPGFSAFI